MDVIEKVRYPKYDNIKGICIFLVVFGHLSMILNPDLYNSSIGSFFYIWAMPAFFFIAGYFSKIGPGESEKAFKRIFIPYVIFCIIEHIVINFIGLPETLGGNRLLFIVPELSLWFLLSLFLMKLFLPILDKFKYPIITSIIVALLFPFIKSNTDWFAMYDFISYLPIFLIGFYCNKNKKQLSEKYSNIIDNKNYWIIFAIVVIILDVILAMNVTFEQVSMGYCYSVFNDLFIKAIILCLCICSTLVLYKFMTNKNTIFTKAGKNSFTVYILHLYLFLLPLGLLLLGISFSNILVLILYCLIWAAIIVLILSRDIVSKALNMFIYSIANLLMD